MVIVPAPNVATYSTRTQYVTAREFTAAPTGVSVDDLVPGGSVAQNTQALEMVLQRASALADNFLRKTIAATVNIVSGSYRVQRAPGIGPVIKVTKMLTPVIAVVDVAMGNTPSSVVSAGVPADIRFGAGTITVPLLGSAPGPYSSMGAYGYVDARVTYVNGWANTALTAAAAAADMTVTVASTLGVMPGQQINVQSGAMSETVTVSNAWVPSNTAINTAVPITTPLVNAYMVGDTVTAFPQDIKQAIILIAKTLILTPGSEAIVIPTYGSQPGHTQQLVPSVSDDLAQAWQILGSYRRIV